MRLAVLLHSGRFRRALEKSPSTGVLGIVLMVPKILEAYPELAVRGRCVPQDLLNQVVARRESLGLQLLERAVRVEMV
jgi:hypothetical protein